MNLFKVAVILSLAGFSLGYFTPECCLLPYFRVEKKCPFVEISGNNQRAIQDIIAMSVDISIVVTPQTGQGDYKRLRSCQATLMSSNLGTELTDVEILTIMGAWRT